MCRVLAVPVLSVPQWEEPDVSLLCGHVQFICLTHYLASYAVVEIANNYTVIVVLKTLEILQKNDIDKYIPKMKSVQFNKCTWWKRNLSITIYLDRTVKWIDPIWFTLLMSPSLALPAKLWLSRKMPCGWIVSKRLVRYSLYLLPRWVRDAIRFHSYFIKRFRYTNLKGKGFNNSLKNAPEVNILMVRGKNNQSKRFEINSEHIKHNKI